MSISRTFANWLTNYDSRKSAGSKLRAKRIVPLVEMIEAIFKENGSVSIIDLGGTDKYWNIVSKQFLIDHNVNITIVNLPGTEMPEDQSPFRFVEADACDLTGFNDKSFHIAHSNSVVEHVGDWGRIVQFADELSRVSKNYFVQTPNYWFPIELHYMTPFIHWLPKPIRVWMVLNLQLGSFEKAASINEAVRIVESVHLLNKKMFKEIFKDANVSTEKFFLLPKSLIAIKIEKTT